MDRDEPHDIARVATEIEADAAARNYGLDPQRVLGVFERTARDAYGDPLPDPSESPDTLEHGLSFSPSLDIALQHLPGNKTLSGTIVFRRDEWFRSA